VTRVQITSAITAVLLAALSLYGSMCFDSDVAFIRSGAEADWITWDRPVELETLLVGRAVASTASFSKTFEVESLPEAAELSVEALGELRVFANGHVLDLPPSDRACFKATCRVALAPHLVVGENTLRAEVLNPSGPQLLRLHVAGLGARLASDPSWQVSLSQPGEAPDERSRTPGGSSGRKAANAQPGEVPDERFQVPPPARPAVVADDTRPFEEANSESASDALRKRATTLVAAFAAVALLFVLTRRRLPEVALRRLPEVALVAVTIFWIFLFAARFIQLPPDWGYDAKFQGEYIHYIVDHGSLPLATDGFSMYHPPLYYGLSAAVIAATGPERGSISEQAAMKFVPLLCGLGMVFFAYALMRRSFADDPLPAFFAVVFTGTLPVNLYMSGYVSNESLFAFLTAAALWLAAPLLLEREKPIGRLVALSIVLGLGLMTKYTALITAPVFVFFLAFELSLAERQRARHVALVCGGVLLGALVVGGWVYLRNWIHFRDPLIWNLDVPGALLWWQTPGFRTLDYYWGFGASLEHPYFSLFHSFWDALYSASWGDGAPPSIYHIADRHSLWNYDAMTSAYPLALPATAITGFGFFHVVREALMGDDLRRRSFFTLVAALLFVMLFSVVSLSLRFPFWGALKASYALAAVVPAAICAGIGGARIDRWLAGLGSASASPMLATLGTAGRAIYYGWFGAFVLTLASAFAG
jgi:hypothetical protein